MGKSSSLLSVSLLDSCKIQSRVRIFGFAFFFFLGGGGGGNRVHLLSFNI